MKSIQQILKFGSLLLLMLVFTSCSPQPPQKNEESSLNIPKKVSSVPTQKTHSVKSATLPVEYQKPSYTIGSEELKENKALSEAGVVMKVGASIHSTTGPQPLRDIIKRLAALKGMNISWASDVDQNALVDVDINANDDFNEAIDHLLRQVNYFHEIKGGTIYIKNKTTRQWHIAMPFISQNYSTETGGDILGSTQNTSAFKGKILLKTTGTSAGTAIGGKEDTNANKIEFDIWNNIETNLKVILDILSTTETRVTSSQREFGGTGQYQGTTAATGTKGAAQTSTAPEKGTLVKTSRLTSKTGAYFTIDRPVGIITVTATRNQLDKVDRYIKSLKKELYKQVNIDAKIIEVDLTNNSDIGIDWSQVLKNFTVQGTVGFGAWTKDILTGQYVEGTGQVWPNSNGQTFVRAVDLSDASFTVLLNALKEQGTTKVLSSPKISVMNGQPAFITVGTNNTYISKVTSTESTSGSVPTITYTVDTSSILSGVGLAITANIMNNNEVILNLVPVTSKLQEPIVYKNFGLNADGNYAATVGLPVVDLREMSTTVKIKNGQMLVIGGLIANRNQKDGQFAPILGDIPIVKYLFGKQSNAATRTELIILLKPTIL